MPYQFLQTSNIDPWLIPKLNIVVDIKDVGTSEVGATPGTSISRNSRILMKLEVVASGIKIALIKTAATRLFNYIKETVANDVNITPANVANLPLKPYSQPADVPQINIDFDVNHSKSEKTVNLRLLFLNLKEEALNATFARLLTYIDEVVTNDMNPS